MGFIKEELAADTQNDLRCYITRKAWTFFGRIQNISFYFAQFILFITVGLFLTITIRAPSTYWAFYCMWYDNDAIYRTRFQLLP